ncbi:MAG TPA: serine hydrolase domain-containing protein [Bradyrhizobium sp.]|jgi:CubicO group peptidase (beta-lactamase class C family)|uniref:serine hydrolase domain-containing protein n=1 Tax=Bradyrhizobium sp. TaxID=376 RepID=UPI002B473A6E|nr:serine hydrolase domain-containing protein [Bradyrhizobium sp.]HKO70146.1 serine hydrolase domain-containing protein [Bradyrhizobium sp.]
MKSWRVLRSIACAVVTIAVATSVRAADTYEIPAGAHFNQQKLQRVGDYLRDKVAQGKIPGAILLIQQHGKPVYHEFFGVRDVATKLPMTDDTIFRIFSLTKPITSVVAMMLIEEGKFRLEDPVSKYIPSFANVKVGVEKKTEDGKSSLELVPPDHPPTILDLMRQTSGITYGFYGDSLVRKAYAAADIYAGDFDNAEFAERIAKLPLANQPGALWQYGHSTDILGRIMELVTGKSLLGIEKIKLLDPLGMNSTGFYVTNPDKKNLIAMPMPNDADFRVGFESKADVPMKWESGGGGMVSTMADLARFSQMILNGGKLDGKQYLSPKTFELMTSDQVGPGSGVERDYFYFPGDGFGFGLGFGVRTERGDANPPPPGDLGELKWDGASGCYIVIDRKQDMFFVLLEQTPSQRQIIQPAVKKLIYEALEN